jgi:hypothetical protein
VSKVEEKMIAYEIDVCTGVLTVQPERKLDARDFIDLLKSAKDWIVQV